MLFGFVDIPAELEKSIIVVVTGLFYLLVRFAVAKLPWLEGFFARYAAEWAMAISVWFIGWLESALPDAYPDVAIQAIRLVLAVLVAIGVGVKFLAGRNVKGFRE